MAQMKGGDMKRTLLLGHGFPLCSLSQRERVRGFVPQAGQGIIHAASVLPASILPIRCTVKGLEEALQSVLSTTPARAAWFSPAQSSSASAMPDGFSAANVAATSRRTSDNTGNEQAHFTIDVDLVGLHSAFLLALVVQLKATPALGRAACICSIAWQSAHGVPTSRSLSGACR